MNKEYTPYKCDTCGNIGLRQLCKEHGKFHGHGMVHIDSIDLENDRLAYWLCDYCSEKHQWLGDVRAVDLL